MRLPRKFRGGADNLHRGDGIAALR